MNRVQAILWDNDGVLVDTERLFYAANRELLANLGVELTPQGFFDWYLLDNCGGWHLTGSPSAEQIERWRSERNRRYTALLQQARDLMMPGIDRLVAQLARQVRMAIVTSAYRDHFDLIHRDLPLRHHFEFILAAEDYQHSKPSPEPYLCALQRLGLAAEQCLVIEDSPRGLSAARAADLRCIVLRHPLMASHDFAGAEAVVDSVAELGAALQARVA